jgi:DNA (cytosine-5)-methyltransferase 1
MVNGHIGCDSAVIGMADADVTERGSDNTDWHDLIEDDTGREESSGDAKQRGAVIRMADTSNLRCVEGWSSPPSEERNGVTRDSIPLERDYTTNPTNGFWRDVDWLGCRDGKFRPVRPGSFPLVDGAASRVVRLRAYGNAINAEAAQAFIGAAMHGLHGLDLI